ncbi:ATP-binding protein [Pseudomonas sp. PDM15]|uniref:AAA family ATPase n=1 Tax=Pseudomonas sp. PDM15 TaxID=2769303 RepID=UPI0017851251|nr:AAA family ATPase [Pseudomonas sp. PDM15]MBD9426137.1 ATP-binding protein [Pseudomonas sp. PDM15]
MAAVQAPQAPAWLEELRLAYESGAHGQFVLYGNVADRFPLDGRLVSLTRYLDARLLAAFDVVFLYDPGNGLSLLRGGERFAEWPAATQVQPWPHEPRAAVELISRYLRYRANLRALGRGDSQHVAVILRGADLVLPAGQPGDFATASLASLVRDWAAEPPFSDMAFASLLLADNLNDLHPLVANNPRIDRIQVPLPDVDDLRQCLAQLRIDHPKAFAAQDDGAEQALAGVSLSALASLVKRRAHEGKVLGARDWAEAKKELVEADSAGLVEFIESARTLDDYHAQEALKTWLRQDMALWQAADLRALPKGYIFCGPVGTGKTYLVECLAGEAGVPVVKLKNFRDRWVGSSEGNLEKIFRLIRGLGRCIVFIDEADQTLGKRDGGSGDSGLSGRLYSMIAQEMGSADNRGKVIWILASSRPDLIEVDLKRPGRVDVKIPLLPTTSVAESAALLRALLKRFDLQLEQAQLEQQALPLLLTPGAAEALAVKVYRQVRTAQLPALEALQHCLQGYQPPVPEQVLRLQMQLAIREATDMAFVPEVLRALGQEAVDP